MKKILYILAAALLFGSCDNWFDIAPKDEHIDEKTLFKNESAFRNAMNGIYTELRSPKLYEDNLTLGGIEFLGQSFVPDADRLAWSQFNFQSPFAQRWSTEVWTQMYKVIDQCNNLIRIFEEQQDIAFVKGSREMMMAELKAMHAVLQYELLRIFHPAYSVNPNFTGVAWVARQGAKPEFLTTKQMTEKIISELSEAILVLKKYDPISTEESLNKDALFGLNPEDRVWKLNYFAALGMKARILMGIGTSDAYTQAQSCAEVILKDGSYSLVATPSTDLAFSKEQLFGLSSTKDGFTKLSDNLFVKNNIPVASHLNLTGLKSTAPDDKRLKWFNTTLTNMSPKFGESSLTSVWVTPQRIPMIKIGEIYLIAAEAAIRLGTASGKTAGFDHLSDYIAKRYSTITVTETSSDAEILAEILHQYQLEFMGEGQLFFCYKRLNIAKIPAATSGDDISMDAAKYYIPIPQK